jgi:hypothetical protein
MLPKNIKVLNALNEFKRIADKYPIYGKIDLNENAIRNATLFSGGLDFRYDRGFANHVEISLEFHEDNQLSRKHNMALGRYKVSVNWSASNREVVDAAAALVLYQEAVNLALVLQNAANQMPLVLFEKT